MCHTRMSVSLFVLYVCESLSPIPAIEVDDFCCSRRRRNRPILVII